MLSGTFAEAKVRDFSETDGDEFAEDYGYSSDSDLEEDSDFGDPVPATPTLDSPDLITTPTVGSSRAEEVPYGKYEESALAGKVIKIQDVALIT